MSTKRDRQSDKHNFFCLPEKEDNVDCRSFLLLLLEKKISLDGLGPKVAAVCPKIVNKSGHRRLLPSWTKVDSSSRPWPFVCVIYCFNLLYLPTLPSLFSPLLLLLLLCVSSFVIINDDIFLQSAD